jgi:hypothetical protein
MTMRALLILAVVGFSATAFAQTAPPKVGSKPLVQVKPKAPTGCKQVGTVQGTKLWAGNCVAAETAGAASEPPPQPAGAAPGLRQ